MAKSASSMNISRIALIVAALLALGAVAVQIYRSMNSDSGARRRCFGPRQRAGAKRR